MAKYHLNEKNEMGVCSASVRPCKFGGATGVDNHFSSQEEALAEMERRFSEEHGAVPTSRQRESDPEEEAQRRREAAEATLAALPANATIQLGTVILSPASYDSTPDGTMIRSGEIMVKGSKGERAVLRNQRDFEELERAARRVDPSNITKPWTNPMGSSLHDHAQAGDTFTKAGDDTVHTIKSYTYNRARLAYQVTTLSGQEVLIEDHEREGVHFYRGDSPAPTLSSLAPGEKVNLTVRTADGYREVEGEVIRNEEGRITLQQADGAGTSVRHSSVDTFGAARAPEASPKLLKAQKRVRAAEERMEKARKNLRRTAAGAYFGGSYEDREKDRRDNDRFKDALQAYHSAQDAEERVREEEAAEG